MTNNDSRLTHLRKLADTMDSAYRIPGIGMRVGADGILGLIPGVGDFFGLLVSSYFILVAAQMRVPRAVLARMFVNVAIDSAVGAIPVLGDLFDFVWKANRKNLALLEGTVGNPQTAKKESILFLICLGLIMIVTLALIVAAIVWLLRTVLGSL